MTPAAGSLSAFKTENVNGRELLGVLSLRDHFAVFSFALLTLFPSEKIRLDLHSFKLTPGDPLFGVSIDGLLPDVSADEEAAVLAHTLGCNELVKPHCVQFIV